ncbi:jg12215, partial [Pararge aegeria aegeria]
IEKDEIFLRRVIGTKKDQFFLNKKVVPRSEVLNLLESAGLSNSNPYYIVKQGKINQMAVAPDSHRLKLLREVAGTRVYDERREESVTILKETVGKVEKINDFLQTIEERLKTLEEEKEELKEYQKWDRARRVLEFIIHDTEHRENKQKLESIESIAVIAQWVGLRLHFRGTEFEYQLKSFFQQFSFVMVPYRKLKDARKDVAATREEKDILSTEQQQLLREKTKLELAIKDLTDDVDGDNKSKERAEGELERLRQQISEKERELEELKPKYEEMKAREEECTRALTLNQQKRQELYAKQGRGTQFTSKQDRDRWIEKELKSLSKQIKDKKDHEAKLREDLRRDALKLTELEKRIEETTKEMERQRVAIDEHNKQYYECKKRKDQEQSARNELWRKETTLTQNLSSLKEDLAKADQALRSMAGKPILNGRDSVRKVLETFQERGGEWAKIATQYYGPVIENFTCDKTIYTAVEVTAGNRLFHHIVESDTVGTKILKEMNRQSLPGEVTFMPLNRLQVRDMVYPNDNNAIAMVQKLKYDAKYAKAMKYIFGKTLICRNLECATELGKQFHLDCVTLEGDQVSSKGSLTGGYFNQSRSRLEMQKTRSELMEQITTLEEELSTLRQELNKTETSINTIVSEMQRTETKQGKAKDIFDKVKADIRLMKEELASIERFRGPKERSLAQCRSSLEAMQATKEGLESELHQELMEQLSTADQGKVDELNDAIRRLTQENKEAFSQRMNLEATKNKLENLLTNNLIRRKDELVQALQEISVEDRKRRLSNSKSDLAAAEKRIRQINKEMEEVERKVQTAVKNEKALKLELDKWRNKEKEAQDKMEEDAKGLEKMASKEVLLREKIQESLDKIAALGTLPNAPELHSKYQKLSLKQLFKELEKANQHLKKYNHVNKKALDQFISFSEQKEKLYKRKEELDIGTLYLIPDVIFSFMNITYE